MLPTLKSTAKQAVQRFAAHWGPHRWSNRSPRLWVLMYHRILPVDDARYRDEEPGMIVTPETFRQQLRILKQLFTPLPLAEWIARRNAGKPLPPRACAITFDDGWRDNFEYALPLLQQEQMPATVFAVSHMIGTRRQFWPNRLARLLSAGVRGPVPAWLTQLPDFRAGALSREPIAAVIAACKQYSDAFLHEQLTALEQQEGVAEDTEAALMDWSQLAAMQASGLVDIGSHTCHHYRLVESLPAETVAQEIIDSGRKLQQQLGTPINLFCYPNGDVSAAAARLVGDHYRAAVTTQRGINRVDTPAQTLLRIGVHEDISNTPTLFNARLSGWL